MIDELNLQAWLKVNAINLSMIVKQFAQEIPAMVQLIITIFSRLSRIIKNLKHKNSMAFIQSY